MNATMNLKDFYAKALLLDNNMTIVIRNEITKNNIGKIQLSNSIKLFDKPTTKAIQEVLLFIEKYATEYYYVPIHDSTI
jgi:hypothetical protein